MQENGHKGVSGSVVGESVQAGLGIPTPVSARDAVNRMTEAGLFDELFAQIDAGDLRLTGEGGFLPEMMKAVLERGLAAEMSDHLGYDKGDPAGRGTPNSRNGSTPKTVRSEVGNVALNTPRAPIVAAAEDALVAFGDSTWGKKYPAAVKAWESAWERFISFLEFPPAVRKITYTTNSIESLNYQLRKIIKDRGHFPADDAVVKLLWLAIRDIEDKRARERAKQAHLSKKQRQSIPKLSRGPRSMDGKPPSARYAWPIQNACKNTFSHTSLQINHTYLHRKLDKLLPNNPSCGNNSRMSVSPSPSTHTAGTPSAA